MNEGSGATLFDANATTANNLTLSGGTPTWASNAGFPGSTLQFQASGVATAAQVAPTNFSGTTPFTVALWMRETTQDTGNADEFFDTSAIITSPGLYIRRQQASGNEFFEVIFGGPYPTNSAYVRATSTQLVANTLYYLVVTYDGSLSSSGFKLYINGVQQTVTVITANLATAVTTTHPVKIGMTHGSAGTVAFVETYNTALTQAQLSANYAAGPGIY